MDRSEPITLVAVSRAKDSTGVFRKTATRRVIFAQVDSITRAEFFEAGRAGFSPELKFTVFFADYQGESVAEYNGRKYGIYRTFLARNDRLELYAEQKAGVNGGE